MLLRVTRVASRLCLPALALLFMAGSVYAQGGSAVSGRWAWKEVARKNKPQTQFTLVVHRKGNVVSGTYSVDEFINGEWQGEDGNQTAFRGRVTRNGAEVEFDPSATVPGYQENVTYQVPSDGRSPSKAVLTLKGAVLIWRLTDGARIEGVPSKLSLHRERRPK